MIFTALGLPMFRIPRLLVLTASLALIPAFSAGADEGSVGAIGAESVVAPVKTGGLFAALLATDPATQQVRAERRAAAKAERAAERDARRAERQRAKSSGQGHSASTGDVARAEVKAAVAEAVANKPKGRIWCVPFARAVTGVEIRGNAKTWWHQAKGRYARGQEPEVGAVMAFSASRAMPKGHVAVVSKVLSEREVLVDQANWERNQITLDTLVVDVSAKGDWSRVKVASAGGTLGRVNPVNGFIYN
jgi:surface antigen